MTALIHVDPQNPKVEVMKAAANIIKSGGVIVYPTDTVYGLGSDALNPEATRKIFKIKNRPLNQPLPIAVSSVEMAAKLAFINDDASKLMAAFWPGALTIVLKKKSIVPSVVVGGGISVGLRMPNHVVSLMLIQLSGAPLVATSANKHGMLPSLRAEEDWQVCHDVDLVLDGGKTNGQPSSVIDLTRTPPLIVRSGPVTREMLEEIVGYVNC